MEKPPREWIDKLFNCMEQFYGNRWIKFINKNPDIYKDIWQSGLTGLTYDEIKRALVLLKRHSQDASCLPPHHLEFFRYAKGQSVPHIDYRPSNVKSNTAVKAMALAEIKSKLRNGYSSLNK